MYLLFVRNGESAHNKQLTTGQIQKKDGSKNEFSVLPGTVKKLEFEYGDKVTCVRGTIMLIIHIDGKQVEGIDMYDRYWMPNHEIMLTEAFMEKHKLETPKLALTGVNHRVNGGAVIR